MGDEDGFGSQPISSSILKFLPSVTSTGFTLFSTNGSDRRTVGGPCAALVASRS